MKRRIQKLILIEVLPLIIRAVLEFGAAQLPVAKQVPAEPVKTEQTITNQPQQVIIVAEPGSAVNYTVNNQQTVYNAK